MKRLLTIWLFLIPAQTSQAFADDGRMVEVKLELRRGGFVQGRVAEYDQGALVLEVGPDLVAINWDDVKTFSASQARRRILASARGSEAHLTAQDHFQLGFFLATRDHQLAATREFRQAERLDPGYKSRIEQARKDIHNQKERDQKILTVLLSEGEEQAKSSDLLYSEDQAPHAMAYLRFTEQQHHEAIDLYKNFGEKVRQTVAPRLLLLETPHFLIWTDWPEHFRNLIPLWAERMYDLLCDQFGFPKDQPIWRGKCPIFCFKSKARFDKFAEAVDQYESGNLLGYTKTTNNGYAHVVLRWLGNSKADLDQFATIMVHEVSHAFMHAYGSPRTLPPWLSEGLAEYVVERVLGDHCRTAKNAQAVARQYVLRKKPIPKLFQMKDNLPAHYYPLAYSLVDFLIKENHEGFVRLIDDLKSGRELPEALSRNFKGMTTKDLKQQWRQAILQKYPPQQIPPE